MGVLGFYYGLRRLIAPKEKSEEKKDNTEKNKIPYFDIYEGVREIYPYTIFDADQLGSFIGNLAEGSLLNDSEKKAFDLMWDLACMDIDGFGHNIPFLKEGCYEIINQNGIRVRFQKRQSPIKDDYIEQGRADFVYLSEDGDLVIRQNERNSKAFLIYVSENISGRLLYAVREAEARTFYRDPEYIQTRRIGPRDSFPYFNIYEGLNNVNPYTIFDADQLGSFIGNLAEGSLLNDSEKKAFDLMWDLACKDIDGFGYNIPFLKEGCFEFFNQDGISARFQKRQTPEGKIIEEGRADFVYLSEDGDFVIRQNENNSHMFLVYVSENISDRLLQALGEAEVRALHLNPECIQTRERLGIPKSLTQAIETTKIAKRDFQEQYRINSQDSVSHYLTEKTTENEIVESEKSNKNDEINSSDEEER